MLAVHIMSYINKMTIACDTSMRYHEFYIVLCSHPTRRRTIAIHREHRKDVDGKKDV